MIMLPNLQVSLVSYIYLPIENAHAIIFNHIAQLHNTLSIISAIYFLLHMHFVDSSRNCFGSFLAKWWRSWWDQSWEACLECHCDTFDTDRCMNSLRKRWMSICSRSMVHLYIIWILWRSWEISQRDTLPLRFFIFISFELFFSLISSPDVGSVHCWAKEVFGECQEPIQGKSWGKSFSSDYFYDV